ncbi:NAD(P)/FAD-dependent oxidoreductase [Paraburkholderia ferrariae]|uniref:Dehydrogenase (Flavoprotein) n=1 Tax=Paraburkholderia ferrariae TaxID=386056 RepID=A0ABU9S0P3_9BURK
MLVIGDGPAGCAAAIVAADAGCEAMLLGRGVSLAAPECVSSNALSLLKLLAPAIITQPDTWLDADSGFTGGRAVVRSRLDEGLRIAVKKAGVNHARTRVDPMLPRIENGRVVGVGFGTAEQRARIVIDASGINGCLRRGLALGESVDSAPIWLRRGFASGCLPQNDALWQIAQDGWLWLRPTSTQIIWTSLSARRCKPVTLRPGISAIGTVWQQCSRWRHLDQAAGPGYFVCGDAAGYLDPASGDGLRFAIESGMRAATLAADVLKRPGRSSLAAALYCDWALQEYLVMKVALQQVYSRANLDIWCSHHDNMATIPNMRIAS